MADTRNYCLTCYLVTDDLMIAKCCSGKMCQKCIKGYQAGRRKEKVCPHCQGKIMPDRWVDLQTAIRMHQAVEGIHTVMREISTGSDVSRWIRATLDDL